MTLWLLLGIVALLLVGCLGYVGWRDRRRPSSPEGTAAGRDARARQHRYEAQRHASQGETWLEGRRDGS